MGKSFPWCGSRQQGFRHRFSGHSAHGLSRQWRCTPIAALVISALLGPAVMGCRLSTGAIVASPLSASQQEQAILEIVPLGTPREEVVPRLEQAGVQGDFGVSESVFYCDVWNRPAGERWHINVALLFDQSGRLYKTRPAQAETARFDGGTDHRAAPGLAEPDNKPSLEGRGAAVEAASAGSRSQDDRRTPFLSDGE